MYNEIDMLKFRISELNEFVDYFIVVESNLDFQGKIKEFNFETSKIFFGDWSNKIIYLKIQYENLESDFDMKSQIQKIQTLIFEELKKLNLDYEDLIMFSEVDEIPPKFDVTELSKFLVYEPIAFLQKNFIYSCEFINVEPHLGTFCFTYSQFLTEKKLIEILYFNKNSVNSVYYRIILGGFHFSHFQNSELVRKKYHSLYGSNISVEEVELFVKEMKYWDKEFSCFENYESELPKNIDIIQKNFFEKMNPKKNLIILNYNQNFVDEFSLMDYDKIFNLNFTTFYHYPNKNQVSEVLINFNIYIPLSKYYDSEKYELEFGLNEIKSIIRTTYPLNHDIFDFFTLDNSRGLKFLKTVDWKEIKNNCIYDLLKNPS